MFGIVGGAREDTADQLPVTAHASPQGRGLQRACPRRLELQRSFSDSVLIHLCVCVDAAEIHSISTETTCLSRNLLESSRGLGCYQGTLVKLKSHRYYIHLIKQFVVKAKTFYYVTHFKKMKLQ